MRYSYSHCYAVLQNHAISAVGIEFSMERSWLHHAYNLIVINQKS